MKKFLLLIATGVLAATMLGGCSGQAVEIKSGNVGKIQTKDGFQEGVRHASKFRLDHCFRMCDRLVTLDVSDNNYGLRFSTFMPKDDLYLGYRVTMTVAVNPKMYEFVFLNVPFAEMGNGTGNITQATVYNRYAKPQLQTVIPSILAEFTIDQIASERAKVNAFLKVSMNEALKNTPFVLKHVGLTDVDYPEIIARAKERTAERKEALALIEQQRELDLRKIETKVLVDKQRRAMELYAAETKSEIAKKLMTPKYETMLKYETLKALAASNNKVFIPTEMLDGLAVQGMVK